jgi:hypothetical protein
MVARGGTAPARARISRCVTRRELFRAAALSAPLLLGAAPRGAHPIRTLEADAAPQHVSFGSGRAFVASGEQPSVVVHALANGARRRRTATPLGSYNVQQGACSRRR